MTLGLDSPLYASISSSILLVTVTENIARFMYDCASFISESRHLDVLDTLVELGCDFNNTPSPHFTSWPKPCPDDQGPDLLSLLYRPTHSSSDTSAPLSVLTQVRANLKIWKNSFQDVTFKDFGGTTPLHEALLHGSFRAVELLIQKSQPLAKKYQLSRKNSTAYCRQSSLTIKGSSGCRSQD
jgi:hypothetical protein